MEDDLQYYARRAAEELRAAEHAESPEARRSHRELAEGYAAIIRSKESAGRAGEKSVTASAA